MSDADKLRAGLARIVGSEIEGLELMGPHTYRVDKVYTDPDNSAYVRCDLSPIESRMMTLSLVDQWLAGGEITVPQIGSLCMVEFRDLKRDRPIITRFQPQRNTGGLPTKAKLDATVIELGGLSAIGVGRIGDAVEIGYLSAAFAAGVVTLTFTTVDPGPSVPNVHLTGEISEGSLKVKAS